MKKKLTSKEHQALIFVFCLIAFIVIVFISIWTSNTSLLFKLGITFFIVMAMILFGKNYDDYVERQEKFEEQKKNRKSFQERLEDLRDAKLKDYENSKQS